MKHTKAGILMFLVSLLFPVISLAVVNPNIERKTLPRVTLRPLVTKTPIITVTATVTPTTVVSSPTIEAKSTTEVLPTDAIKKDKNNPKDNMAIWFLAATIGLLLIIIIAQAWPKDDDSEK